MSLPNEPGAVVDFEQSGDRKVVRLEEVVIKGDLQALTSQERLSYYAKVCESLGLNPFTKPFLYLNLGGKLVLYATRDCTDQLRRIHGISIDRLEAHLEEDIYVVVAYGRTAGGRVDSATGAVPLSGLKGEAKANAIMKCETKAKRRLTLSLAGLGWLDETEVESIEEADVVNVDLDTGEIKPGEWVGKVEITDRPGADMFLRTDFGPLGSDYDTAMGDQGTEYTGFKLLLPNRKSAWVLIGGEPAVALFDGDGVPILKSGDTVNVTGEMSMVDWEKNGKRMPPYRRIVADAVTAA